VQPISARLPNPSALNGALAAVVSAFETITSKAQGFSPADLGTVLQAGQSLPIPNGLALIDAALNNLNRLTQAIPADPKALTATTQKGLEQLITELIGMSDLLAPLDRLVEFVTPLLSNVTLLRDTVTRINTFVTGLPAQANSLDLSKLPEQFKYFSNIFNLYPEAMEVSLFKALKAQIDTFHMWMTSEADALSQNFRDQIQTLADALPAQLDQAMQSGLAAVQLIGGPLSGLERAFWYEPYGQALDLVAGLDLGDLSQLDSYLATLDDQVATVAVTATNLSHRTEAVLSGLAGFDPRLFSSEVRHAFLAILNIVSPEKPGVLAVLFRQIQRALGAQEISRLNAIVTQVEAEVEKLVGDLDLTALTDTLEANAERIVGFVQAVNQALVQVATSLSNLVAELRILIAQVNLPALVNQVQEAFGELRSAAEALLAQVNNISNELATFVADIGKDIANLDVDALTQTIQALLAQIVGVLEAPEIKAILDEAKQGIGQIAESLESITLKPVFDRVVQESNDLKTKLGAVDVSDLNDFLRAALKTALDVIRSIDFASQVAGALRERFNAILGQSAGLVEPLEEKYGELTNQINQFDPGTLATQQLTPPFEALTTALNKIKPASLLTPLQDLQKSLLDQLDGVSPTKLLGPLSEVHAQLSSALQALSPRDLIAPLNDLLGQLTGLLDDLGLEELIAKITDSVTQLNGLMTQFSLGGQIQAINFWDTLAQSQLQVQDLLTAIEDRLDQFLDQILGHVPEVDMSLLQPALTALQAGLDTIKTHITTPEVLTRFEQMAVTLDAQNFSAGVTDLTQRWLAQKARFEVVTPPPELSVKYDILKERVRSLSPIVVMAGPAVSVGRIAANLDATRAELSQTRDALVSLLEENRVKLEALLPAEPNSAGFTSLLRDTLDEQLGQPIRQLLQILKLRLHQFVEVVDKIKAIAIRFQTPFEALTVIPENIQRVGSAIITAKNQITNLNLNFLEDELQGVLEEVVAQFEAVNPAEILSGLETTYQNALSVLRGLYPEAAVQNLDAVYRNAVLKKVETLHPTKTVAEPLNQAYQNVLKSQEALRVEKIFEALTQKLEAIDRELEDGLDRSGRAFKELVAALPL
jgi:hypothetical protein